MSDSLQTNDPAQLLMAYWKQQHDTEESVVIRQYHCSSHFIDAVELLCQAIENGTFHKPISLHLCRQPNITAVLGAIKKGRLTNVRVLRLWDESDLDYDQETKMLSQCIENGNLEHLEYYSCRFNHNRLKENEKLVSPVATGKAPNLVSISFDGYCDLSTQETMAQAIADRKLPKLKELKNQNHFGRNNTFGQNLFPVEDLFSLNDHLETLRIPEEYAYRDNDDILQFLHDRWKYGEVEISTAKVIVTGPSAVGKTCLVSCLKGNAFNPDPGSTNTMDIGKKQEDGGLELLYHDFGGQRVYTTTQGHFLKTAAVFIVAWENQRVTGVDPSAHQYARDVLDARPKAKIIFVTTKSDLEGHEPLSDAETAELKDQYGDSFIAYYHVSAKANIGVRELLASIKSAAKFVHVLINKPYAELRKSLARLREPLKWKWLAYLLRMRSRWYVTGQYWDAMLESANIEGDKRCDLALRLFQDMGEIVRLSTGHIVVDPSALVDALAKVVTADDSYKQNARGGYLRHDELDQVWVGYPKVLREGFLKLIHDCDIGFPVCDENQAYRATLIPAMLVESSGMEMRQGLKQLSASLPTFRAGPDIVVELSNLSNQFWTKLIVMLRDFVVLGGWSENGCIIIDVDNLLDGTDDVESFGAVVWDSEKRQISVVTFGRSPQSVQLVRCRSLNALRLTLKDFPGVYIEQLYMESSVGDSVNSWTEQWSEEALILSPLDTATFENRGAPDVAEWVLELRKEAGRNKSSAFEYFVEMLRKDSASEDVLCYLVLKHQDEMLRKGCEHGRMRLNALWLIYDTDGGRMAYPFCPHLRRGKVRVMDVWSDGAFSCDVSDVDLHGLSHDQIAVKTLVERILKKLGIDPPRKEAAFRGLLWTQREEDCVFMIKAKDKEIFQPVYVDGFEVYVHASDQLYFTNTCQVDAIKNLTDTVKNRIRETRTSTVKGEQESPPDDTPQQQRRCMEVGEGQDLKDRIKNTLLESPDNGEEDVGALSLDTVEDPHAMWPMSSSHYVFLSHTGHDNVKAEIARPTHWFLTKVVGVKAFLDEWDAVHGSPKMETLMPPAYMCTHALVILSPSFRQRMFCVKELNTFMARWRSRDGICVLPALWLIESLEGYHPDVYDLVWIGNARTRYPVDYMVKVLWPALLRQFGEHNMTTEFLERHLVEYVESNRGGIHEIPSFLETFVARKQGSPSENTGRSESGERNPEVHL